MIKEGRLINPEVRIETTNYCNAHCVICPRDTMTRQKITMCYGKFVDLVDQCIDLGATMVSPFGYGEPLMDIGLEEKVEYCTKHNLSTFITSNGSLLTRKRIYSLIDSGLKNIRFSVHAVNLAIYEKVHNLSWLTVFKNIGNFIFINDKAGHPVTVHITVIPLHDESVDMIRSVWEKNCEYLEIWRPHNWGGAKNYRKIDRKKQTCGRPLNGPLQIQADGTVIPCCFLTNSELVLGDTNKKTIWEILNGLSYFWIRNKHIQGDLAELPCETCDQLNLNEESPLLYSNRDPKMVIGKTSTAKVMIDA